MPISAKVEPIAIDKIFASVDGLTPQGQSKAFAAYARRLIAEGDAQNLRAAGRPVPKRTFVDGRENDDLDRVKPDGVIVAEWDLGLELIQWIYAELEKHSPVLTGDYERSIKVYADGEEIEDLTMPRDTEMVTFLPAAPYARKIERGESKQAPDGVFQAVAVMAQARFGNIAKVSFAYDEPIGGADELESWARKHSAKTPGDVARRRQYAKDTHQPAVVVRFK
jgi:hypothetical protein